MKNLFDCLISPVFSNYLDFCNFSDFLDKSRQFIRKIKQLFDFVNFFGKFEFENSSYLINSRKTAAHLKAPQLIS